MITVQEQIDLFDQLHKMELFDLFSEFLKDIEQFSMPLLNSNNSNLHNEFIELIMNNVDLKKMFINYYKKDNLI